MTRPLRLLGAIPLAALVACSTEATADRAAPRVVVRDVAATPASGGARLEVGPEGGAPEVIVLEPTAASTPAAVRPAPKAAPARRVVHETVYVYETADPGPAAPSASPTAVAERAAAEPPPPAPPTVEEPVPTTVATAPAPVPAPRGSSRAEDAIVGAAIGAGIGAVLGGGRGALGGAVGGAIGGATGGKAGGVLGGVLGGASSRGRIPRGGGGCRGGGSFDAIPGTLIAGR